MAAETRERAADIVKAARILGISLLVSSIILGVGAIVTVTASANRGAIAVEQAAERVMSTLDREFGEPMQLQTTLAMPEPVIVQGQGIEGGDAAQYRRLHR